MNINWIKIHTSAPSFMLMINEWLYTITVILQKKNHDILDNFCDFLC